jgi:hypothetical protein
MSLVDRIERGDTGRVNEKRVQTAVKIAVKTPDNDAAPGSVTFFAGATTRTLTTNSILGTEKVAVIASQAAGSGAVTASYGGATQTLELTIASSQPQSIVIAGERASVSGQPGINVDGSFTWERKTGKRLSVYVTSEDGVVKSNTFFIPAP